MTSIIEGFARQFTIIKSIADIIYFYASLRYPLFDPLDDLLVIFRVRRVWGDGHNDVPAVDQRDFTPEISLLGCKILSCTDTSC